MAYAFARDGGLPSSPYLYFLNESKIPTRALLVIIVLDALLIVPSLLSSSLFAAINSIGTVGEFPCINTNCRLI
jgi:amino acid transporter